MALPLKYNFRNVFVRWRTTAFTVAGIGAVVAVFVLLQALARGIESTGGNTGDPRNILVVRRGSQAESGSLVSRDHFRTLQYFDEIARNEAGEPVISAELVMIVSAPRREGNGEANTLIRGITPRGMELRPQASSLPGAGSARAIARSSSRNASPSASRVSRSAAPSRPVPTASPWSATSTTPAAPSIRRPGWMPTRPARCSTATNTPAS